MYRKPWVRPAVGTLLGCLVGFALLHPYVMLLASMGAVPGHIIGDYGLLSILALDSSMLPMVAPWSLLGGAFGCLAGAYVNRAQKMQQLLLAQQRDATSLETVKVLTATLSHYLLNANMIIGGKVRRCKRLSTSPEALESLDVIEEQGKVIDAAIGALRELARVVMLQE
jgi:signal transduction histidine kinase